MTSEERARLRTPICDLFGIDVPIVQASLGAASSPVLTAAASNAGALGTLGVAILPPDMTRRRIEEVRELTDKPFAINTTYRPLREDVYDEMLAASPAVVSISLGISKEIVDRAHDAGSLFMVQIDCVERAEQVAELGVDAVIAQGWEAGGLGGDVATMVLTPQVVDRVSPIPVLAAGGSPTAEAWQPRSPSVRKRWSSGRGSWRRTNARYPTSSNG